MVSTALVSAAVAAGPVALVVGDLSFLHDLNALVAASDYSTQSDQPFMKNIKVRVVPA